MKNPASGSFDYVHKQFKDWSLSLFCFDAGLSFVLTYPLGWVMQMPWKSQLYLFAGILFTLTSAIFVYLNASQRRVREARKTLRDMAASIDVAGSIGIVPALRVGTERDSVAEAGARLRAMFKQDVFNSYHNAILFGTSAPISAKAFLEQLTDSVSHADFRD